ncbi:leucine-rich repeat-containing protein kinase family protein [Ferribacterium limneticum]|uniref:leucine-rich repeat-containing protein kinase family protein n=1 Tax=Ferribacterium limneticum TaxID=76259 RepID=UPI001CF901C9|nr:leucine-rich repeat-containing protein kinase family protein [Ferribacterium limneticum]UCV26856.1 serine/threonine-protein kinase [Ferribacterium limneticum]UCV30773.1 serine/threonine-protein kinase [Ferribacterium limneticum]
MPLNTLEDLRTGKLAGSRRIKLACGLSEFPREIFALADTLEILDLSGNDLSALPDDLPQLHKLRILFCSDNRFTELSAVIGQCAQLEMVGFKANQIRQVPAAALPPRLRWLILTDNRIAELPPEIGSCLRLQKLMLAGNQLRTLPAEMASCTNLELVRIAANQLAALPEWLLSLPRLSWLAFAGNPFCQDAPVQAEVSPIHWDDLQVSHQLGEGASGVIHQAEWRCGEGTQPVALKLFKGAMTSDGLPLNEMNACITAGMHPHLIPVLGKLAAHPEEAHGLVMALIDSSFRNLAGPPSLDSCTRDVYPEEASFDLDAAIRIAHGIASAAEHLHAQGIVHGDLYGHNILHGDDGQALLGDFGAASFVPADNPLVATALQRIEVRAFSCLLEELLALSVPNSDFATTETKAGPGGDREKIEKLQSLQANCAQENVAARPLFAEIVSVLGALRLA